MSDAKLENKGSAPNGTDGRMLSLARRRAMSLGGKSGGGKSGSGQVTQTMRAAPSETVVSPDISASDHADADDCGCTHTAEQQALDAVCDLVETNSAALGSSAASVRQLCQARRKGLSNQGKTALGSSRKDRSVGSDGKNSGAGMSAANGLSGRVRATLADTPAKVEVGSTLSGNVVTGTQVERTRKVTGIGAGSCLAITGTEYIGSEQYSKLCTTIPAPAPAKVGSGSTSRGQRISGTELGRSEHVTGDERGANKRVTGNEYLNAEQFELLTASKPNSGSAKVPAKTGVTSTQAGQRVSGTEVGRSTKVTGDEPGACLKLTGSQYSPPDASGAVCQGSGVPHKVSVMSTVRERPVTGTDVAASASVTGSEYGACSSVTGIAYAGLEQYQACSREPVLTPEKVSLSRTWREQTISGTAVEHNPKVTGDEYGGCQPISGTEYIGSGQYSTFCPSDSVSAAQQRVATPRGAAGESTTGVGLNSGNKVTGSARSSVLRLSGTPYSDDAQYAVSGHTVSGAVGMSQHPLTRRPSDRSKVAVASAKVPSMGAPVQSSFSVITPARTAQASQLNRITGAAYGAQGRITGPVNLAIGLVSGTPEFRYREESVPAASAQTIAPAATQQANRVTGEGREAGFAITGAAWRRDGSTTGTEGVSAARRNPTLRGDQRSMALQLTAMKEREQLQVPPSKVTGSSGNTATGSTITYSGGARG